LLITKSTGPQDVKFSI